MPTRFSEAVVALVGRRARVFDGSNLADVVTSPHPITDDIEAGDVVWSVHDPTGTGDHLCIVRVGKRLGAISRSFGGGYEGTVSIQDGKLLLKATTGEVLDMLTADFARP